MADQNQQEPQQAPEEERDADGVPAPDHIPPVPLMQHQQVISDDGLEMSHTHHNGGGQPMVLGPPYQQPPFLPHQQQAMAMAQYYEARMRDHAAAYASAAAGAAWAAAQIAVSAQLPPSLPPPIVYPPPHHQYNTAPPHYYAQHVPTAVAPSASFGSASDVTPTEERPVKRHQRMHPNKQQQQEERRGRRRQRVDYSSSSDGVRGSMTHHNKAQRRNHNNHKKRREKLNLVGKTGVSALHEWCVHRKKLPPKFVLLPPPEAASTPSYFCFAAYVDELEWSRGRGATKGAAKQDAARKALQALVPGVVVFDDNGLVVEITSTSAAADELPHLAQRLLAIGDATAKKRRCEVHYHPGTTTTTTEDEDDNAYYESRGASVFTALVHAMWQIKDDIPEPPSYSFVVPSNNASNTKDLARPSSFACTATLKVIVVDNDVEDAKIKHNDENESKSDDSDSNKKVKREGEDENVQGNLKVAATTIDRESKQVKSKLFSGVGTGATKREARHVASAKLLAMLFPACEGMVEVKAAAEAYREEYAASKALKQQTKRSANAGNQLRNTGSNVVGREQSNLWLAHSTDPDLPQSVVDMVRSMIGQRSTSESLVEEDEVSVESLSLSETTATMSLEANIPLSKSIVTGTDSKHEARACSRQQQLEEMVEDALQTLNEFDEEGRILSHEPNFDDVGRTVLRRAEACDARFVYKLLRGGVLGINSELSPMQNIMSSGAFRRFWGPTSVTVLLCRAIASYDEPPLGCAVLTLGFSLTKGRVLRVAEIGSQPHLPRERFVECLQQFSANMKCKLDIEDRRKGKLVAAEEEATNALVTAPHLTTIVNSYLKRKDFLREESGLKLQAVKEEEPELEDDSKEVVKPKQVDSVKDKPSKRSRID